MKINENIYILFRKLVSLQSKDFWQTIVVYRAGYRRFFVLNGKRPSVFQCF